jgi:hypothetical protein
MNYYTRTQQVLAANARQSAVRLAYFEGMRGLGQSSAGVPAGSQLLYRVTYALPTAPVQSVDPKSVLSRISSALIGNWGIRVVSETDTAPQFGGVIYSPSGDVNMSLTVLTTIDYGRPEDVQANIDHEIYNAGLTPRSTIAVIQPGTSTPTTPPAAPPSDIGAFLSENWGWIALGGVAFLLLSEAL